MRAFPKFVALAGLNGALVACGGGGSGAGGSGYTVGGSIAGLLSPGLVLSDATTTVSPASGSTSFTFPNAFSSGAMYTVTVQTQPAGLTCTVSNGSGQVGSAQVNNVAVVCPTPWVWQSGTTTAKVAGSYGTEGIAAAGNTPGARDGAASWTDSSGNLWLFGGYGYDSADTLGYLSDLWNYTTSTGLWTWVSGPKLANTAGSYGSQGTAGTGTMPGARQGAVAWIDATGNLWLFGGYQQQTSVPAGFFNDLWMYSPASNQWTWISGANTVNGSGVYGTLRSPAPANIPSARAGAVSWIDATGNFWLFGGSQYNPGGSPNGVNDLWEYAPTSKEWTWMSGSSTVNAPGVYGSVGSAAAANVPGARDDAVSWIDANGSLWLFGGDGYDSKGSAPAALNDLWKFTPSSGEWTWVSGSSVNSAVGVYGTLGTAAGGNTPGARVGSASWIDANGNLWLFGGSGYDSLGNGGALNDVWKFSPAAAQWTWITGFEVQGADGVYGTLGKAGANAPGGRAGAVTWVDGNGNFWAFGGIGLDSTATLGDLNDLWEFKP